MSDGVELFRLYQRGTPDGDTFFVGTLGDAGITVVRDQMKRDVWRVIAVDPSRANNRNTDMTPARAGARPAIDDRTCRMDEMDDDLPEDLLTLERKQMTKTDHDDWHTGEFEQIKPVAPSPRGRPPKMIRLTPTQTDDIADDQGQGDEPQ
ncbi:hypothetical protein ACTGJ9_020990 [Bradyrhizobium sp. RDM12]